jgi:hypothetical protein
MVLSGAVFSGHVAAVAEGVPLRIDLHAVRFVAITAYHAGLVHPALEEGCIFIDLFQDLPVGKIEVLLKQRGPVCIQSDPRGNNPPVATDRRRQREHICAAGQTVAQPTCGPDRIRIKPGCIVRVLQADLSHPGITRGYFP